MKLSELSVQFWDATNRANEDLSNVPLAVRSGREAAKNAAAREAQRLRAEFRAAVAPNSGYIVLKGLDEAVENFIEVAVDEGNAVVVMADDLSYEIAETLWPTMPGGVLNASHIESFGVAISNILNDLGARANVQIHIGRLVTEGRKYGDTHSLANDIKALIRKAVGVELEVAFLQYQVAEEAILRDGLQNFVPVLITHVDVDDKELILKLCGPEVVEVEATEGNEEAQVKQAFTKLKAVHKAKRK